MKAHRPADIETEVVEAQLGNRVGRRIEIVAGIKRIVAAKIESGGVKLLGART